MKKSQILYTDRYKRIEADIANLINSQTTFLSMITAASTRGVGDAIQTIVAENFETVVADLCVEYSAQFARRAMADLAFTDCDGFYYVIDVKTHRADTHFNMPNLISVERLTRFYEDDKNYFVVLIVKYVLNETTVQVQRVHFVPIEFLSWDCLTIGALGWGQIQIANSNNIRIIEGHSRRNWMLALCDVMLEFYPREILKTNERIEYFRRVRTTWEQRSEA